MDVRCVFCSHNGNYAYVLRYDDSIKMMHEREECYHLTSLLVSSSNPDDISKGVFRHDNYLNKDNRVIEFKNPVRFEGWCFIIRIYKDISLLYDNGWGIYLMDNYSR